MAADTTSHEGAATEFQSHRRGYDRFIAMLKWSTLVVAIITLVVVLIISS